VKLLAVTVWVVVGAAATGAAYWAFLITPESTMGTLAVSALLLLTASLLAAFAIAGAIAGWRHALSSRSLRAAVSGVPAIVPAAFIITLVWWLAGGVTDGVSIYSGQISAWFIATFGWSDVSWLFTGIDWLALWVKWVVAPLLGVSIMADIMANGWRAVVRPRWLGHALGPIRLGMATLIFAGLVAAPWVYLTPWRPQGLPATSVELLFIIAKLSATALLMAIGVALFIRQSMPLPQHPGTPVLPE